MPKTVTGLLVRRTFAPTLALALRLHPSTAHVYVVGGTSPFDRDYRGTVLSGSGIGVVLLGLVVGLLYERRGRRRAEVRTREQLTITAHLGRQLAMGEVNLLINAMDAVAPTDVANRRALVKTTITRHVAEVSVQDRGEGIADAVRARVFEPFVTTKAKGMGIGLAMTVDLPFAR